MKRRDVIILAGAAFAASLLPAWSAYAQLPKQVRRIGILMPHAQTDPEGQARVGAFRAALEKLGRTIGRDVVIIDRWAGGDAGRARAHAADLVRLEPDVIMVNGTPTLAALQHETKTIPIVFAQVSDPVGAGLIASVTRPEGNVTGFADYEYAFSVKWLELLKEISPSVTRVAVVHDPANGLSVKFLSHLEMRSSHFGVEVVRVGIRNADDIERHLGALSGVENGGLIVLAGSVTLRNRERIISYAARHRLPAVYPYRAFAESGGLASYGVDILDLYRGAASYVDRILKGERAAGLPVQFATKFEFVVNLKTAKTLEIALPTSVLLRASEVIE